VDAVQAGGEVSHTLTAAEKILLALYYSEQTGLPGNISAGRLVELAWKRAPDTFSLEGTIEPLPDANKILTSVMGRKRGMVQRGWLARTAPKTYALTRAGRTAAERLLGIASAPQAKSLPDTLERDLLAWLDSDAAQRFSDGRKDSITFRSAAAFWSVSLRDRGAEIDDRLSATTLAFRELEDAAEAQSDLSLPVGNMLISVGQIRALANLNRWLMERFSRILDLLRHREVGRNGAEPSRRT
jgi:hypothetical protein